MANTTSTVSLLLAILLLTYLGMGILYALYTPAWQVPDEPAHYNYVRHLAETGCFPVLQMGDYPHEYLEEIKARRFPPDLSIDPIRYEFHQPPLYYLLAAPIFWLSGGRPLPLRLFSVALGGVLLLVAYRVVRTVFPRRPALALGATAFVAFVPMHLATTAGVENDTLAELLLAIVVLLSVRHIAEGGEVRRGTWRRLALLGIVLGLVLVTKTTAYAAVPVTLVAVVWEWRIAYHASPVTHQASRPEGWRSLGWRLLATFGPALAIALPWYVRNGVVYGWSDVTGLRWHDAVVVGQPRTAEWIARYGWGDFLRRFADFSFKSFWGVFGWMGVFLDSRIYLALGLLSALVAVGFLALVARRGWSRAGRDAREKRGLKELRETGGNPGERGGTWRQLVLLGVWVGWTALQYLAYNVTFVQHQGRYLFPALMPIGLAFALGWREALRPRMSRWLAVLLGFLVLALAVVGLVTGDWHMWSLVFCAAGALGLFIRPWLPRRLDSLLFALPFIGLAVLDLVSLFVFIVPKLS